MRTIEYEFLKVSVNVYNVQEFEWSQIIHLTVSHLNTINQDAEKQFKRFHTKKRDERNCVEGSVLTAEHNKPNIFIHSGDNVIDRNLI